MIKLIVDDVEISVNEDNPLYKSLKRFDGESLTVRVGETTHEPIAPPEKTFSVEAEPYYTLLQESFPKTFLETPTGAVLRSHLDNIFPVSGLTEMVKVGVDYSQQVIFATKDKAFTLVNL